MFQELFRMKTHGVTVHFARKYKYAVLNRAQPTDEHRDPVYVGDSMRQAAIHVRRLRRTVPGSDPYIAQWGAPKEYGVLPGCEWPPEAE